MLFLPYSSRAYTLIYIMLNHRKNSISFIRIWLVFALFCRPKSYIFSLLFLGSLAAQGFDGVFCVFILRFSKFVKFNIFSRTV